MDQNYSVGDYQTMSTAEKIDFLHKVHIEEISLWDDDGNENEIWKDYDTVQDELLCHPEMLDCEDVLHIMRIFDDDCFELSWQLNLTKMLCRSCQHDGKNRTAFYLRHLQEVPPNGRLHGWHFPIQLLLEEESFGLLKEAVLEQTTETKKIVLQILDGIEIYQAARDELRALIESDNG